MVGSLNGKYSQDLHPDTAVCDGVVTNLPNTHLGNRFTDALSIEKWILSLEHEIVTASENRLKQK